ncbi:MAG: hypothetical protein PVH00_14805 [Gemmatimonadota bacterium]|jgi:hypothetical protein
MARTARHAAPWIFWPIAAVWDLLAFVLRLTGRLVAGVIGLVLLTGGGLLSFTIVGAPLGIPLAIVGLLLLFRSLF